MKNTIQMTCPILKVFLSKMYINSKGNRQYDENHYNSLKGNLLFFHCAL